MGRLSASAIVCTRDRPALLTGCLTDLSAALDEDDELIVVESGDSQAAAAIESLGPVSPAVTCIRAELRGKSHQLNVGIRAAKGEVILLTDDDVRVEADWPAAMLAPFADPGVGLACGRVLGLSMAPGWDRPHPVSDGEAPLETWTYAHGAAMAVRKPTALEVGGFDERLGPGTPAHGEEHDFVLRVRQRGWRVVVAAAPAVRHVEWRSDEQNRLNALVYERGGGAFVAAAIRRQPGPGLHLLRRRLGYQRRLFAADHKFGVQGGAAFAGGLAYGLRLSERNWLGRGGPNDEHS